MGGAGTRGGDRTGRTESDGYAILNDRELILALYQETGSFYRAGLVCGVSGRTFREYFLRHGLVPRRDTSQGKLFWTWVYKKALLKVRGVPERCPKDCPGWEAEPDCLDGDCIFPIREEE